MFTARCEELQAQVLTVSFYFSNIQLGRRNAEWAEEGGRREEDTEPAAEDGHPTEIAG